MVFANDYDIECWIDRYAHDPVLSCAANTLRSLADGANSCSDGWAYWAAPCKSAEKLITLLRNADQTYRRGDEPQVTEDELKLAYRPIKAFHTRYGAKYGFNLDLYYPVADAPPPPHEALTLFA
jgi:hypothetical protein